MGYGRWKIGERSTAAISHLPSSICHEVPSAPTMDLIIQTRSESPPG